MNSVSGQQQFLPGINPVQMEFDEWKKNNPPPNDAAEAKEFLSSHVPEIRSLIAMDKPTWHLRVVVSLRNVDAEKEKHEFNCELDTEDPEECERQWLDMGQKAYFCWYENEEQLRRPK
jgi:hypothetical protein